MVPAGTSTMQFILFVGMVAAAMMTLGVLYRVSVFVLLMGFTYLTFCDQCFWNNHYYFISLLLFVLLFLNANCCGSMNRQLRLSNGSVRNWEVLLLKSIVAIVYFYGGLTKLNPDWLAGQPMQKLLNDFAANLPKQYEFVTSDLSLWFFTYGGMFFDFLIIPVLWYRKTRILGVLAMTFFHGTNAMMFEIGIFPPLMWAASLFLFSEPDMPRRQINKLLPGLIPKYVESNQVLPLTRQRRIKILCGLFLAFQLIWPFRHLAYSDRPEWNYYGKLFAWRMMSMSRSFHLEIYCLDFDNQRIVQVNPRLHMPSYRMATGFSLKIPVGPSSICKILAETVDIYGNEEIRNPSNFDCLVAWSPFAISGSARCGFVDDDNSILGSPGLDCADGNGPRTRELLVWK